MQDGLEVDLLNFLLGQPESRGKAHANTINLLVPFGLKRNAMFFRSGCIANSNSTPCMQLYSVKPTEVGQLAFASEKHKISHQEGHLPFL